MAVANSRLSCEIPRRGMEIRRRGSGSHERLRRYVAVTISITKRISHASPCHIGPPRGRDVSSFPRALLQDTLSLLPPFSFSPFSSVGRHREHDAFVLVHSRCERELTRVISRTQERREREDGQVARETTKVIATPTTFPRPTIPRSPARSIRSTLRRRCVAASSRLSDITPRFDRKSKRSPGGDEGTKQNP